MTERITSVQAAKLLGTDRTTTQRAARNGEVQGAVQEPRTGSINAPWVATEAAWTAWHRSRRPVGRPTREETIRLMRAETPPTPTERQELLDREQFLIREGYDKVSARDRASWETGVCAYCGGQPEQHSAADGIVPCTACYGTGWRPK